MPEHTGAVEARIAHIADLMRSLRFVRGDTVRSLAQEWGLTEQRIREMTAEASKRVAAEVNDPARVGATVGTALEEVITRNLAAGEDKLVIDAAKTWAQVAGAMAPQRFEVATAAASPARAAELVRETFGRVTPKANVPASDDSADGASER